MQLDERPTPSTGSDRFLSGGGVMGELIRRKNWDTTRLGPPSRWSLGLKAGVRMMLDSRIPMWLAWGDDRAFFCNDAYRTNLDIEDTSTIGQPAQKVWQEIWPEIGTRVAQRLGGSETACDANLRLLRDRDGHARESYHTFSYSPLYDDAGGISGVLCVVTDETERVIGDRRFELLHDLGARLAAARTDEAVVAGISTALRNEPRDIPWSIACLYESQADTGRVACCTGIAPDHLVATSVALRQAPWRIAQVMNNAVPQVIDDLSDTFAELPHGPWDKPPTQAVVLPLTVHGQSTPTGVFVAAVNPYGTVDNAYRAFLDLSASLISPALADSRADSAHRQLLIAPSAHAAAPTIDHTRDEFLALLAHELRNPLAPIRNSLHIMKLSGVMTAAQRRSHEMIDRQVAHLVRLVDDLLDVSRIGRGKLNLMRERVSLAGVLADALETTRPLIELAQHEVELSLLERDPVLMGDEIRLTQVFANLLSNAAKYTPARGTIRVHAELLEGGVVVRVADNGIGLAPDALPRLFMMFTQNEHVPSQSPSGLGIGLALVKGLVEMHLGRLSVESDGLGRGSVFSVWLPLDDSAAKESSLPTRSATADAPSPRRVLIVDDNLDAAESMAMLIGLLGHRTHVVRDGDQAVRATEELEPDLILMDLGLPTVDGFEAARRIRALALPRQPRIVAITGLAQEADRQHSAQAGIDAHLVKPVETDAIVKLLSE